MSAWKSLADPTARRVVELRSINRMPVRWIVSETALALLRAEAADDAWGEAMFLGVPFEIGRPRSEWGLELLSAPIPPPPEPGGATR